MGNLPSLTHGVEVLGWALVLSSMEAIYDSNAAGVTTSGCVLSHHILIGFLILWHDINKLVFDELHLGQPIKVNYPMYLLTENSIECSHSIDSSQLPKRI